MMRSHLRGQGATSRAVILKSRLATARAISIRVFRFVFAGYYEHKVARQLSAQPALLGYRCNVCGHANAAPRASLRRENESCWYCQSTVRVRAVVDMLSTRLLGSSMPLGQFPKRREVAGLGLSDSHHYATGLRRAFRYRNTFLHRQPRLDLVDPPLELAGTLDFLVASEVLEHVQPPVCRAFEGARLLLKDGGIFVVTTPYDATAGACTVEHYPRLHNFSLVERERHLTLVNRTLDGDVETFEDPPLHGGEGLVLEMRLFSLDDLCRDLLSAGFRQVEVWNHETPQFGIVWNEPHSVPLIATA